MKHSDYIGINDTVDYYDAALPPKNSNGVKSGLDVDTQFELFHRDRSISHSLLQAYGTCHRKGELILGGNPSLQPTLFAQAHMKSGIKFEQEALNYIQKWVAQVPGIASISPIIVQVPGMDRNERISNFEYLAEEAQKSATAKAFLQVPLYLDNGEAISGIPKLPIEGIADIIIWDGEKWTIGDTKCAETAQASYGNQVTLYSKIWRYKYPAWPINSSGFIAHCAEGNLYSIHGSKKSKIRALENITITPISYSNYEESLRAAFNFFSTPCEVVTFKPHCIECQFRYSCYRETVETITTDISLFPGMTPGELELMHQRGIKTVEKLLELFNSGSGAEFFSLDSSFLPYLRGRAEAVIKYKGFSSISIPADMLENSVFIAYSHKHKCMEAGALNRRTKMPVRKFLHEVDEDWLVDNLGVKTPSYVVAYTPQDANHAYHIEQGKMKYLSGKRVSLLELIRDHVHLPLTSYGLLEVTSLLEHVVQGNTIEGIKHWRSRIDMEDTSDMKFKIRPPENTDYLSYLELCLHYLYQFGELSRKEELKYVQ